MKTFMFTAKAPPSGFKPNDLERFLLSFPFDVSPAYALQYVQNNKEAFPLDYEVAGREQGGKGVQILIQQRTRGHGGPVIAGDDEPIIEDTELEVADAPDEDAVHEDRQ